MPTYLPRAAAAFLAAWRTKSTRKPLLLRGARQVGKSTLVRHFARSFARSVELNLERRDDRLLFDGEPSAETLLARLALRSGAGKLGPDTLLFIDEIQESPAAIALLRFLHEDFPEVPVIAAGSLLEFALGAVRSFPVGRVEFYTLRPLSFSEFLTWTGREAHAELLATVPPPDYAHEELLAAFHEYAIVGGMPEVVAARARGVGIAELADLYEAIWTAYRGDAEKYATNDTQRQALRHLLATAALADDRVSFANFGGSTLRSDVVGPAFRALELAGLLQLVYPSSALALPVTADVRKRPRIQFLDTGLLNHARGLQADLLGVDDLTAVYRGRIAQHVVSQEIVALHHRPSWRLHFWVREKGTANAEVDLLLPDEHRVYPLEVKAGPQGRLRSLHQFVERSPHDIGLRALRNRYSAERVTTPGGYAYTLVNIPYYAASQWRAYAALAASGT